MTGKVDPIMRVFWVGIFSATTLLLLKIVSGLFTFVSPSLISVHCVFFCSVKSSLTDLFDLMTCLFLLNSQQRQSSNICLPFSSVVGSFNIARFMAVDLLCMLLQRLHQHLLKGRDRSPPDSPECARCRRC